jgi:hypothetical protein
MLRWKRYGKKQMRWVAFLALLAVSSTANAACSGRFAHLKSFAGEYPDRFLKNPVVQSRMSRLMGAELAHLKRNLLATPPVALIDCELVVEGNAPHQGGNQNAILSFNLYSGIMTVAILDGDRVLVRTTKHRYRDWSNYSHLPAHVRDWIYVAADHFHSRGHPPSNVVLLPAR